MNHSWSNSLRGEGAARIVGLLVVLLLLLTAVVWWQVNADNEAEVEAVRQTEPLVTTLPTVQVNQEAARVLPRNAIPAIDDPPLVPAADAANEMKADELVIGVELEGEARAYPINVLSTHEIVNDTVAGRPIAITWCPLCYTALVFDRTVAGQLLTFEVSGKLLNENLVMVDREIGNEWSQLTGQAIAGPLTGQQLDFLVSSLTTWDSWLAQHPATTVLSKPALRARFARADYALDPRGSYEVDPYASYYRSQARGVVHAQIPREAVDRPKQLILGVRLGGTVRAYPLSVLTEQPVVNDVVAGVPLVVSYDPTRDTAAVFRREVDEMRLTFHAVPTLQDGQQVEPLLRDEQTGTVWSGTTGMAVEGTLAGERLDRLPSTLAFWFAWRDFYPQSEVYGEGTPE